MIKKIFIAVFILLVFVSFSAAQNTLFSGQDWLLIDKASLTHSQKRSLKTMYMRAASETMSYHLKALVMKCSFNEYIDIIDIIYRDKENIRIPLIFVMELADMIKLGLNFSIVDEYRKAVLSKS